jgi:hypothetical protein
MLTLSPKPTNCCAPCGPARPNTVSPVCTPSETAAARPYSFFQRSPIGPNSPWMVCAVLIASALNSFGAPATKAATSPSLCTESTLPVFSLIARAAREKNSLASSSTMSGCSTSESRVKLRSSA